MAIVMVLNILIALIIGFALGAILTAVVMFYLWGVGFHQSLKKHGYIFKNGKIVPIDSQGETHE